MRTVSFSPIFLKQLWETEWIVVSGLKHKPSLMWLLFVKASNDTGKKWPINLRKKLLNSFKRPIKKQVEDCWLAFFGGNEGWGGLWDIKIGQLVSYLVIWAWSPELKPGDLLTCKNTFLCAFNFTSPWAHIVPLNNLNERLTLSLGLCRVIFCN